MGMDKVYVGRMQIGQQLLPLIKKQKLIKLSISVN